MILKDISELKPTEELAVIINVETKMLTTLALMSTLRYAGHGVEIEDDAVRLRRRKLEFDYDAVRRSHQSKPSRRKDVGPVRAISAALARWR